VLAVPVSATLIAHASPTASAAARTQAPAEATDPHDAQVARLAEHARTVHTAVGAQMAMAAMQVAGEKAAAAAAEAQRVAEAQRAADERVAQERASRSREVVEVPTVAASGDPRSIARTLLAARGQGSQFSCLDSLWTKESGWKTTADTPTSSAYGIPQALPGSKMASAGADWRTSARTQILWGLSYIADRYGSPCAAWSHSKSHNWY
jgi:hypothetical protein